MTVSELTEKLRQVARDMGVQAEDVDFRTFHKLGGVSQWAIRQAGGMTGIRKELKRPSKKAKEHPLVNFTREGLGDIIKKYNVKEGVFFITAASPTTPEDYTDDQIQKAESGQMFSASNVHRKAFKSVLSYCEKREAELVILPMRAHVKALREQPRHYDPILKPYIDNFATEFVFNRNLKALDVYLNPQQINPLTGLSRLRGRGDTPHPEDVILEKSTRRFKTSIIVAHSKQNMKPVATGNNSHPRILHSTGAITRPAYLRNRIGMIASEDHVLGGLVVEIKGSKFFVRQVQIDPKTGSFVDLGRRYHPNGRVTRERAEAFKMGDLHPGYHSDKVLNCWYDVWKEVQPKRIFLEDFFDGQSISHHVEKQRLTKWARPLYFKSLERELKMARGVIYGVINKAPIDAEIVATYSNHPEHVTRYLEEGRYVNDDVNYEIAHRMVVAGLDGKSPLQEFLDPDERMHWLGPNEDYFVEGVQLGGHGHLGVNGSRGSQKALEEAYGDAITAHSHTPSIFHRHMVVGHSTNGIPYAKGPSTWIPASGILYKGGAKQLVMVIDGEWRLKRKRRKKRGVV